MCLAIPGKIISIEKKDENEKFVIDYGAEKREALGSAIDVKKGDYVIVSNKIIVTKVSEEDAKNFYSMLNEN